MDSGNLPVLTVPEGSMDLLLEGQIATCSGVIGQIADHITRNGINADVCANFVDRIASLMTSSARVGKVVGQLRASAGRMS